MNPISVPRGVSRPSLSPGGSAGRRRGGRRALYLRVGAAAMASITIAIRAKCMLPHPPVTQIVARVARTAAVCSLPAANAPSRPSSRHDCAVTREKKVISGATSPVQPV